MLVYQRVLTVVWGFSSYPSSDSQSDWRTPWAREFSPRKAGDGPALQVISQMWSLPSGFSIQKNDGKSPFLVGKSTISMGHFQVRKPFNYQRVDLCRFPSCKLLIYHIKVQTKPLNGDLNNRFNRS